MSQLDQSVNRRPNVGHVTLLHNLSEMDHFAASCMKLTNCLVVKDLVIQMCISHSGRLPLVVVYPNLGVNDPPVSKTQIG